MDGHGSFLVSGKPMDVSFVGADVYTERPVTQAELNEILRVKAHLDYKPELGMVWFRDGEPFNA